MRTCSTYVSVLKYEIVSNFRGYKTYKVWERAPLRTPLEFGSGRGYKTFWARSLLSLVRRYLRTPFVFLSYKLHEEPQGRGFKSRSDWKKSLSFSFSPFLSCLCIWTISLKLIFQFMIGPTWFCFRSLSFLFKSILFSCHDFLLS